MLIEGSKTVCKLNNCTGCMACVDICPKDAIKIVDDLNSYNAVIDFNKCVECDLCNKVCQQNHPIKLQPPVLWYQGWAEDDEIRKNASSGGIASAISNAFFENGGIVCSCVFSNGQFKFQFAENVTEINKFAGSKYVKSNPKGIYLKVKNKLIEGQKVLFIGLPCQVAGLKKFVGEKYLDSLYTVDLICHGTPSPKLLQNFLNQYKVNLSDLNDVRFRVKGKFQISDRFKGIITNGVCDRYSIAFLNSLTYTENCYECNYAKKERVSDITLGDSWGSKIDQKEQLKGVSLVLCQTEKGKRLLDSSKIHLEDVCIENAISNNKQLSHPSIKPKGYEEFFKEIKKGKKLNNLVTKILPKQSIRQDIKEILIKCKIIKY